MGRFTRVVAVDVPHHVTQRGNGRRFVLERDADRTIYLNLLRENIVLYGVALIGYCLMSSHIHLIAIPHKADGEKQGKARKSRTDGSDPKANPTVCETATPLPRPRS